MLAWASTLYMIFGKADVLNSVRFDLIFVSTRSYRRQRCVGGKFSQGGKVQPSASAQFSTDSTYLWTFFAEIGVELDEKFAASVFHCLDWNVTRLFGMMWKNELYHIFPMFFILFISENIVTIYNWCKLREIRIWVKRK